MSKIKRYHREVYYPEWAEKSAQVFFSNLVQEKNIVFSIHALGKILGDFYKYGQNYYKFLLKSVRTKSFGFSNLFEFYAVDGKIQKGCLRFSYDDLPVDIIIVISSVGIIITTFTTRKGDYHDTMDKSLYEKGEKK